ncbi:putative monocarboxylate transporter [Triangularia verruculosa]|uniref:Monocarboxylate transporter n=1 Tax=Triangularia verruculosa TaxID=2587418 RepID=A0AAN6X9J8_9PEZI|nr:putative monocarboxylate transporter [Triangularia verruculosa]
MGNPTTPNSPLHGPPTAKKENSDEHNVDPKEITYRYPEGGFKAWTVAFGSWCAMTCGMGLVNSVGMFQALVATTVLPTYSNQAIGWIFGIFVFVSYFCGVQIGPVFDRHGPQGLMALGTVCLLVGIFTTAQCTEYYQFILAFSILTGAGCSLLFTPAIGAISHWFDKRRGTASGFAFVGSALGGVMWPLMMQSLVPKLGWPWALRIVGFVLLVLCVVSVLLCRSRLEIRQAKASSTWRDMLPDPRMFVDGTGAMAFTTAGVFFIEWAYFVPVSYIPSYYLARQGLAEDSDAGGDAAFAYQLLAIINGASCIGRYLPGYIADKAGRYNTMVVSIAICLVSVACFWLPDALGQDGGGGAGLITGFAVLFGLVSGSNITLVPICLGQLCETHDYGRYYATSYTVASLACLTGIPIAGGLVDMGGQSDRRAYWRPLLFAIASYVGAFGCFFWVRVRVKGWNWRVKW